MSKPPRNIYARVLDVVLAAICVLSAAVLACAMAWPETVGNLNVVAGISFTISVALLIYSRLNPDTVRARQSDTILKNRVANARVLPRGFRHSHGAEGVPFAAARHWGAGCGDYRS